MWEGWRPGRRKISRNQDTRSLSVSAGLRHWQELLIRSETHKHKHSTLLFAYLKQHLHPLEVVFKKKQTQNVAVVHHCKLQLIILFYDQRQRYSTEVAKFHEQCWDACGRFLSSPRLTTHQENREMCEVITETAGSIGGHAPGHTAAAAPTPLPTWHTQTHADESCLSTDSQLPEFRDLNWSVRNVPMLHVINIHPVQHKGIIIKYWLTVCLEIPEYALDLIMWLETKSNRERSVDGLVVWHKPFQPNAVKFSPVWVFDAWASQWHLPSGCSRDCHWCWRILYRNLKSTCSASYCLSAGPVRNPKAGWGKVR